MPIPSPSSTSSPVTEARAPTAVAATPLYRKVAELVANRIYDGTWSPGALMPTEFELADEFEVSQGTVRKALNSLETAGLIERRQGRGTFVGSRTAERSFFHFFRLARPGAERVTPQPRTERLRSRKATRAEREAFGFESVDEVYEIARVRSVDGVSASRESIVLPRVLFPDLAANPQPLPCALYPYYQRAFGVFVLRAEEYVAAIDARDDIAADLEIEPGVPVLEIKRTAFDMKERVVELRLSQYRTDRFQYQIDLS